MLIPENEHDALIAVMQQAENDLKSAHDEICKLQDLDPVKFDWPEWSPQANSLRWFAAIRERFAHPHPSANADAGVALSARQQLRKQIAMALYAKRHEPISAAGVKDAFQFYEQKFANEGYGAARITAAGQCVELADVAMLFVQPQPPDGWAMVPREPTEEMCVSFEIASMDAWAASKGDDDPLPPFQEAWNAALAAAPKPQVPGGE